MSPPKVHITYATPGRLMARSLCGRWVNANDATTLILWYSVPVAQRCANCARIIHQSGHWRAKKSRKSENPA